MIFLSLFSLNFFSCDLLEEDNEVYMTGISITKTPSKTSYYIGEEFNSDGIVVKANYIGRTDKDITNLVQFVGFDSSHEISYQKITVLYTENGKNYTNSFYIEISKYPQATYPYDKNRIVKVSFQYYRRESTADAFEPYIYSEENYGDINGTVTFKINEYGMNYKVGDVVDCYMYYPNKDFSSSILCNIDDTRVKPTKYFNGNEITLEMVGNIPMPYSFLFTDKADELLSMTYGTSSEISVIGTKTLIFEDDIIKNYKSDYNEKLEHITFKGIEYPQFKADENNFLIKGTILKQINNYFVCILSVETTVQDVEIDFPAELWGIDHLE